MITKSVIIQATLSRTASRKFLDSHPKKKTESKGWMKLKSKISIKEEGNIDYDSNEYRTKTSAKIRRFVDAIQKKPYLINLQTLKVIDEKCEPRPDLTKQINHIYDYSRLSSNVQEIGGTHNINESKVEIEDMVNLNESELNDAIEQPNFEFFKKNIASNLKNNLLCLTNQINVIGDNESISSVDIFGCNDKSNDSIVLDLQSKESYSYINHDKPIPKKNIVEPNNEESISFSQNSRELNLLDIRIPTLGLSQQTNEDAHLNGLDHEDLSEYSIESKLHKKSSQCLPIASEASKALSMISKFTSTFNNGAKSIENNQMFINSKRSKEERIQYFEKSLLLNQSIRRSTKIISKMMRLSKVKYTIVDDESDQEDEQQNRYAQNMINQSDLLKDDSLNKHQSINKARLKRSRYLTLLKKQAQESVGRIRKKLLPARYTVAQILAFVGIVLCTVFFNALQIKILDQFEKDIKSLNKLELLEHQILNYYTVIKKIQLIRSGIINHTFLTQNSLFLTWELDKGYLLLGESIVGLSEDSTFTSLEREERIAFDYKIGDSQQISYIAMKSSIYQIYWSYNTVRRSVYIQENDTNWVTNEDDNQFINKTERQILNFIESVDNIRIDAQDRVTQVLLNVFRIYFPFFGLYVICALLLSIAVIKQSLCFFEEIIKNKEIIRYIDIKSIRQLETQALDYLFRNEVLIGGVSSRPSNAKYSIKSRQSDYKRMAKNGKSNIWKLRQSRREAISIVSSVLYGLLTIVLIVIPSYFDYQFKYIKFLEIEDTFRNRNIISNLYVHIPGFYSEYLDILLRESDDTKENPILKASAASFNSSLDSWQKVQQLAEKYTLSDGIDTNGNKWNPFCKYISRNQSDSFSSFCTDLTSTNENYNLFIALNSLTNYIQISIARAKLVGSSALFDSNLARFDMLSSLVGQAFFYLTNDITSIELGGECVVASWMIYVVVSGYTLYFLLLTLASHYFYFNKKAKDTISIMHVYRSYPEISLLKNSYFMSYLKIKSVVDLNALIAEAEPLNCDEER